MRLLVSLFVLLTIVVCSDALQCYVGKLSLTRGSNKEKDVYPVLTKCNPSHKCCKSEMALSGATWSCATDCPAEGDKCGFEENHNWCWCLSATSPQCNASYRVFGRK